MKVELQALEFLVCMEECVNKDVREKEEKEKEKKGHFYTLWLQVFDRENFCEKPTFCIIKNF